MAEFRMPSLGADMDEGTLLEWLVQVGDTVHKGDIVAVVDTAKAAVEVECFESGVIEQLLIEPGTRVPVGTPLAVITAGEVARQARPTEPARPAPPARPVISVQPGMLPASPLVRRLAAERHVDLGSVRGTGPGGRITHADVARAVPVPAGAKPLAAKPSAQTSVAQVPPPARRARVSPLARRLAAQLGVDLATVTGTGPGGAIDADDVRRRASVGGAEARPAPEAETGPAPRAGVGPALEAGVGPAPEAESPAEAAARRAAAMRSTIAALMARSKREIPHYYLAETVDLGAAVDWLSARNRELPVNRRLVPAVLLLKAAARAAATVRELNGFWVDDAFVAAPAVHLGVAVSLRGGGLVAPAIHDADALDLAELMARLRDLVARVRAGRLRGAELADPTITVSNLGEQGVEAIHGVIYPPQVALVGFGAVVERPWAVHGLIGVRPTVVATLAADHRATDGATGARYLRTVAQLLQKPEEL